MITSLVHMDPHAANVSHVIAVTSPAMMRTLISLSCAASVSDVGLPRRTQVTAQAMNIDALQHGAQFSYWPSRVALTAVNYSEGEVAWG